MTIENYVICKKSNLPSAAKLAEAIAGAGIDLTFAVPFDPAEEGERFVACNVDGRISGFDYATRPYEDGMFEFDEDQAKKVGACDFMVQLSTFSNAQEIAGSYIVAALLSQLSGGALLAEFEDEPLVGEEAAEWLTEVLPGVKEQFNGPCKFRGHDLSEVERVSIRINIEE